jgi:long-chain acyl-CoA synthetase
MHPLLDLLETHCAATPDQLAVRDAGLRLDYQNLQLVAGGLAGALAAQTKRPLVGVLAPTSAATAAAILACWYAGKTPVPLNFLLSPPELSRIVRDASLDLLLAAPIFAQLAESLVPRTVRLEAQSLPREPRPAPPTTADEIAVVLYTSGTSGHPKGVCLSFDNLVQNTRACAAHARLGPAAVFLGVLPQSHSFGFTAMTVVPLLLGATAHYLPRFSPLGLVQALASHRASVLMAIPSMYAAIANLKNATADMFASLQLAISGGEPLPARIAQTFEDRFGVTLCEGYGMTETSPVVSINTPWAYRRGSVGRPIPGVTVVAIDGHGRELPSGTDGELVVRGHCVMRGYLNQPEQTAAAIRDGVLRTGDVGHVDADGYVHITGRAKEMLIVGGENVFPQEIESVLLEHPAVAEAAVIATRDESRGELPAAFVILKAERTATESELREFCRGRLAGYKIPRWVRFAVDLPRSPTGKILKRSLVL